jgi:hypothetical protein
MADADKPPVYTFDGDSAAAEEVRNAMHSVAGRRHSITLLVYTDRVECALHANMHGCETRCRSHAALGRLAH